MSAIDIRDTAGVHTIIFANSTEDDDEREIAHKLVASELHEDHIFVETLKGSFATIRRKDVAYLIKALHAAQDLWEGCK